MLEVEHPAGRIFVDLAQKQDKEVGDGTTSVVIIAAELLRRANELVKAKIHPTTIIAGYRHACREACKFLVDQLSLKADSLGREALINAAKTSMSSKVIGGYVIFLSRLPVKLYTKSYHHVGMMTCLLQWLSTQCLQSSQLMHEAKRSTL